MKVTRTRLALIGGLWLVLILTAPLLIILLSRHTPPPAPSLQEAPLALSFKPAPASKALSGFLRKFAKRDLRHLDLRSFERPLRGGKWWFKADALTAKRQSFQQAQQALVAFRTALKEGGCPHFSEQSAKQKKAWYALRRQVRKRYLLLVRFAVVEGALLSQENNPNEAARRLGWLLQENHKRIRSCIQLQDNFNLWLSAQDRLLMGLVYPLSHASLSVSQRDSLFKVLLQLERASAAPVADYLRLWLKKARAAYPQLQTPQAHPHLRMYSPGKLRWPWYVADQTKGWFEYAYRIQIKHALQPYSASLLQEPPKVALLGKVMWSSKRSKLFQHNFAGMSSAYFPTIGKLIGWHRSRCIAAAVRHKALRLQQKHKRPLPTEKQLGEVVNPLTKKPFPSKQPTLGYCRIEVKGNRSATAFGLVLPFPAYLSEGAKTPEKQPTARR